MTEDPGSEDSDTITEHDRRSEDAPPEFESARAGSEADIDLLVAMAARHAASIADDRGADLMLRRELPTSEAELAGLLRAALNDENACVVVGVFDGVPFGYGLVSFEMLTDGAWLGRLDQILVEPEARGVGIGESIMNEVLDEARRRGCIGLDSRALPGDRATKNFFESFGLKARQLVVHYSFSDESPPA